jgi:hypothetical protein
LTSEKLKNIMPNQHTHANTTFIIYENKASIIPDHASAIIRQKGNKVSELLK